MPNTHVSIGVIGGVLAIALVLTGCGGSNTTAPANPTPPTSSTAQSSIEHNDADIAFAQMMIPHHRDAVAMAELAADRAQNAEVKTLAEQIRAAQQPEIDQLTACSRPGAPTLRPPARWRGWTTAACRAHQARPAWAG